MKNYTIEQKNENKWYNSTREMEMDWICSQNVQYNNMYNSIIMTTWRKESEGFVGLKQHQRGLPRKKDHNWVGIVVRQQEWKQRIDISGGSISVLFLTAARRELVRWGLVEEKKLFSYCSFLWALVWFIPKVYPLFFFWLTSNFLSFTVNISIGLKFCDMMLFIKMNMVKWITLNWSLIIRMVRVGTVAIVSNVGRLPCQHRFVCRWCKYSTRMHLVLRCMNKADYHYIEKLPL